MSSKSSSAFTPPRAFFPVFWDWAMRLTVANRTWKNSSRLFEKIPKNRNRSIKGTVGSAASCSTRALKSNQLSSLLIN